MSGVELVDPVQAMEHYNHNAMGVWVLPKAALMCVASTNTFRLSNFIDLHVNSYWLFAQNARRAANRNMKGLPDKKLIQLTLHLFIWQPSCPFVELIQRRLSAQNWT